MNAYLGILGMVYCACAMVFETRFLQELGRCSREAVWEGAPVNRTELDRNGKGLFSFQHIWQTVILSQFIFLLFGIRISHGLPID